MSGRTPRRPADVRNPPISDEEIVKTTAVASDTSHVTADHAPQPAHGVDAEALTTTILTAVERQLTRYFSAMSKEAEAARTAAEQARADFEQRIPELEAAIEGHRAAQEAYQLALQSALEERLTEFANHQHWRLTDLEERVSTLPTATGIDAETLMDIRQTVRDDMERSFTQIHGKIDDLAAADRRLDEQAAALVQHANDTAASLAERMDEGDRRLTAAVEEQLASAQTMFTAALAEVEQQVGEHTNTLVAKLESADSRTTDRMLALEQRINDEQGTKIANIEATVGRLGNGFDEAMVALSQRVLELENRLLEVDERIGTVAEAVARIDQDAMEELKAQMSNAIGEAMLVRIELDRVVANTDEKLDKQAVRLTEIEALLTDEMDVGQAVQLERIDELERAIAMLDPKHFGVGTGAFDAPTPGTSTEMASAADGGYGGYDTPSDGGYGGGYDGGDGTVPDGQEAEPGSVLGGTPGPAAPTGAGRMSLPSLSLNPRLPGADTAHGDAALDHETTYTPY